VDLDFPCHARTALMQFTALLSTGHVFQGSLGVSTFPATQQTNPVGDVKREEHCCLSLPSFSPCLADHQQNASWHLQSLVNYFSLQTVQGTGTRHKSVPPTEKATKELT
ncbi:hypothetical protein Bbelb_417100, partial [Branchiostoma belcheri]